MSTDRFNILNQPFPLNLSGAAAVRLRIGIALLVYFILVVLQPFGIATSQKQHLFAELSGYGFIAFFVLSFFEIYGPRILPSVFREETWTVGKAILWMWFIIFVIGIFNAIYFKVVNYGLATRHEAAAIFLDTFLIGIFPFALGILGRFTVLYHTYKRKAEALSLPVVTSNVVQQEEDHTVSFFQDNKKTKVLLRATDIYVIESSENYITIYSIVDGELKKMMIRCTLQSAEESTREVPMLVRCHRSYIVNLRSVSHLSGNAQGYKLQVDLLEKPVPVSRKYEKSVVEQLGIIKNNAFSDQIGGIHSSPGVIHSAQG